MPDHDLYVKRLEAILDVIDKNKNIRKYLEEVADGISFQWIDDLRACIEENDFRKSRLHNVYKLVSFLPLASPNVDVEFQREYLHREMLELTGTKQV